MEPKERCQIEVHAPGWGSFHPHQCEKKAVLTFEGKRYCKIHSPEQVAKREAKATEKWERENASYRLKAYAPALLFACKEALKISHEPQVQAILSQIINKAEGKE